MTFITPEGKQRIKSIMVEGEKVIFWEAGRGQYRRNQRHPMMRIEDARKIADKVYQLYEKARKPREIAHFGRVETGPSTRMAYMNANTDRRVQVTSIGRSIEIKVKNWEY